MSVEFKQYLKEVKFEQYLNKLKKKVKNKKIIIYGAGSMFRYIKENYDLSSFNVIGISDAKYTIRMEENNEYDLGYKIIHKDNMINYLPDYVIVSTQQYLSIIENFALNTFSKTKVKIYPLVRIPLLKMIKDIWNR